MARAVVWTKAAARDLDDAAAHIARDSRFYAAALVREARAAARSLAEFAERGRPVPEAESKEVRELFVRSYRLIYHTTTDQIGVLAFVHGARDLPSLLKRQSRVLAPAGAGPGRRGRR